MRPILLVEDMDTDYEMVLRRFRSLDIDAPLERCVGVDDAHTYLGQRKQGAATRSLPAFLILDLKLPDGDGQEVLATIQEDEFLKQIPVVVWTASSDPKVKEGCLENGAARFLQKAADRHITDATINCFVDLWRQASNDTLRNA